LLKIWLKLEIKVPLFFPTTKSVLNNLVVSPLSLFLNGIQEIRDSFFGFVGSEKNIGKLALIYLAGK